MIKKYLMVLMKKELYYFFYLYIKLFISLLLLLYINNTILNAQWVRCKNGIESNLIYCFNVISENTYVGVDGGIYMTTNNGNNWITKNSGLELEFYPIQVTTIATNDKNIYAGTWDDGIYLSIDKGENWVRKSNGLPFWFWGLDTVFNVKVNIIITNGNYIFAGTDNGIYISTNKGDYWFPKNNGLPHLDTFNMPIYSMAISDNYLYAGTDSGVYMTTNNGDNWYEKNNGIENLRIHSLAIKGSNIYSGSEYGGMFISTIDGDNWKFIGFKNTIVNVLLISGNNIFASGSNLYLSTDNGISWIEKNSGLPNLGVTSLVINNEYIFAGIWDDGVYRAKLSDLGITDVKEPEQTNGIKIYPNPASDEFRLRFYAPTETTVQLSVFDLLGNKVLSRTEQAYEGTNEKNINCEQLPHGYYYVKININEIVETIPLVIIK
ncbi:MAG: T9SS type A sorting domain-containing protein [Bacteroidetes bacterium]|nr:MAG: T9SS type A sorting domain-containing protein [Bacteroidota bacterium]